MTIPKIDNYKKTKNLWDNLYSIRSDKVHKRVIPEDLSKPMSDLLNIVRNVILTELKQSTLTAKPTH